MLRPSAFLTLMVLATGVAGFATAQDDDTEATCVSALSDQTNVDQKTIVRNGTEPSLGAGSDVHMQVDGTSWTCSVDDNGDIIGLEPDNDDTLDPTGGFDDGAGLYPGDGSGDGN